MTKAKKNELNIVGAILLFAAVVTASFLALIGFIGFLQRDAVTVTLDAEAAAQKLSELHLTGKSRGESVLTFRSRYGLDPADYESVTYFGPSSNMDVEEMVFLVLSEDADAETVSAAFADRLSYQKTCFESYGVEQMKYLNDARVVIRGRYCLFLIGDHADVTESAFLSMVKGGDADVIQ